MQEIRSFLWPFCNICHLSASQLLTTSFSSPQHERGYVFLLFCRDLRGGEMLIVCLFVLTAQLSANVARYVWHSLTVTDRTF